ncbi:PASTA domain-containing protein [Amycolatopsis sp. NPDC004625]|uniref:PASTA domain-containing protein n=1 Tax=Amycolatopsis sp. NPDC004625 TaxID=3154670 RepID=UPI0033A97B36
MVTTLTALAFATAACGTPPTTTPPASASASPSASLIKVPDVSGMNHQDAQNAMQRAGLYNLREVDGTGQGRALVIDRNWVQTGQTPAPGTEVTPDTVITLTAVKYTDH